MPTSETSNSTVKKRYFTPLPIWSRRVFRLSFTIALSLAIAYGMGISLPYLAPLFAYFLGMKPSPPMPAKALLALIVLTFVTMGMGLLVIPILIHYPMSAILLVGLGLFASSLITIHKGNVLVGTFLTIGFTLISLTGSISFALALTIIQSLVIAITVAVLCQWLVYPFFPEHQNSEQVAPPAEHDNESNWLAVRSTLIVLPAYCFALTNPMAYLPIMLKSVALSQQSSGIQLRIAARELLGSTFLGGCFAILYWFLLDLVTELWAFSAWMLVFSIYFISKFYQISKSYFSPSFWQNAFVTMIILLGPSVEDSANGNDVYAAFAVRLGLFFAVTIYAILAMYCLEMLKQYRQKHPH